MGILSEEVNKAIKLIGRGINIKGSAKYTKLPLVFVLDELELSDTANREKVPISGAELYNLVHRNKMPLKDVSEEFMTSRIELKSKLQLFIETKKERRRERDKLKKVKCSREQAAKKIEAEAKKHVENSFKYLHPAILVGASTKWVARTDQTKRNKLNAR